MCGRFALAAPAQSIIKHFNLTNAVVLTPRFNIAPSQVVPVMRVNGKIEFLTWGLRPHWLKTDQNSFINARMETLQEKPAFRNAFKKNRCLVLADGYYEWKQVGNIKQPFFVCLPDKQLFAFAAIYEGDTCCLITKAADHEILSKVHDRMPVILAPEQYALWLTANSLQQDLQQAMLQNNLPILQVFPVSTKVNNPNVDSLECVTPLH